ncbi:sugar ABC transporter substrate-binding protein [Litorilinea aerophila]|uniref:Sugar ABC transporter substrate-binding protein n=1 Tax=Litorilinea aerophila TaxID=1204385 RepID=A0A540VCU3_9CHLR|nr:sugar ABC transporter substrate-binding protein [Litorilinea aerophila]MCC9077730.1 sugar ABC transporter substrate-binding protein [Litorilinea aerophila]OUC09650.1 hypothetical protein RY27_01560 [Litorilinea aerophila]
MLKFGKRSGVCNFWAMMSLLLAVLLVAAACVPAGGPAPQGGQAGSASEAGAAQGPRTTVRIGSWDSGEALEPFNNAIAAYESANPNVDIQLEAVPQEYGTKLLAQLAAGTAPDIFQVGDGDVAKFVARDVVEPLEPYINGNNPLDMDVFFPNVAQFGIVNGQVYYLTKDYSPLVLYYNKDLFDEAGLDYPTTAWTWDDLLTAAQALTVRDDSGQVTRWGIQLPDTWGDLYWLRGILPIIYQGGGSVISEDGTTVQGHINSPETVAALEWYVALFKEHGVAPDNADLEALAGVDLFQNGMVAMVWTGRWPLKDYLANESLNFGVSGLPTGPAGKANVLCWAGFALNKASENKETAWDFLKYIAAGDGAKEFANYAFTAVRAIAESQHLDTDEYNAPIIADLENVRPLPEFTNPRFQECVETPFKEQLERVFLEDISVQEAMDAVAASAEACLAAE